MEEKVAGKRTIEVFGSQTLRVKPDLASITFSVTSKSIDANDAVAMVVKKADRILKGLKAWKISSVDSSQARLTKKSESKNEVIFFDSNTVCEVTTTDVDKITDIQLKIVELGAENIVSTKFVSTELKAYRKQARMEAMKAAVEKAKYYCEAANIRLGPPITIDDVDPTFLEYQYSGHRIRPQLPHLEELPSGDSSDESINVSGAVRVLFELIVDDFSVQ